MIMTTTVVNLAGIHEVPPELYPIIISYLPLYATPLTVLTLATTNRHISEIVIPLLHRCIILRDGDQASTFLKNVIGNLTLGKLVRELHIMAENCPPGDRVSAWMVVERLQDVISRGCIPSIRVLDVQLMGMEYTRLGRGYIQEDFWIQLKEYCPQLHAIVMKGFLGMVKTWFDESCIMQIAVSMLISNLLTSSS